MKPIELPDFDPDYEERTFYYRGKVIAHFAKLEKTLESFLSIFFSTIRADRRKIQNIIFDRMTFENKRTSVKTVLLDLELEKGFVKTKSNAHPHKKLLEDLNYLNTTRNHFAHYVTLQATSKIEYEHAIGLIEYRDSPTYIWYSKEKIDEIIAKIEDVKTQLTKLRTEHLKRE
jgi:hypothetical protein